VVHRTGRLSLQANGSLLTGPDGKPVGSRLIAQPFTKDEYFQPRPSAASYNAAASASSSLAASNYALRDRVARTLGPIVKYRSGARAGQLVAPDVESWFGQDKFQGNPHIVAQWRICTTPLLRPGLTLTRKNGAYVDDWAKKHPANVAKWIKDNPGTPQPKAADLAVLFFETFSGENPGKFPSAVTHAVAGGKTETTIETGRCRSGYSVDLFRHVAAGASRCGYPGRSRRSGHHIRLRSRSSYYASEC